MSEFWEFFWGIATPSLILGLGMLIGALAILFIPVSEEAKKQMAEEIEDGASSFASEFTRPFDKVGLMFIGRLLFNYIVGMLFISIIGAMATDAFNLPQIRETTLRLLTEAAQHLPTIIMIPLMISFGQESIKLTGKLINWLIDTVQWIKELKKI